MNCKEFEKNIPDFIAGKLDFQTLQEFGEHMRECPGCKEELVIQFLVTEGMQRLEDGDAFDLQRELELRLAEAKRKVRFHMAFLGRTGSADGDFSYGISGMDHLLATPDRIKRTELR